MSNRIDRVNSLLEHEISKILLRDFDFSRSGDPASRESLAKREVMVTLTRVETTANLIEAKAYISVLPDNKIDKIIKTLNNNVYDVQKKINQMLNMRPIPKITFVKDEKIAEAARVEELLEQLKKE